MKKNNDNATKLIDYLMQIKAIKLQPETPFTWASGWKSPIYCDNRKTISYPKIRTFIRQELTKLIDDNFGTPEIIAGVATGAIPHAALVANQMGVPMIYVRSDAKDHGLGNQIEGFFEPKQSVVVIEDLISTGGSSIKAVKALREAGLHVMGMVAIFSYGFAVAEETFKKEKCPLFTLANYEILVNHCISKEYIKMEQLESLKEWRKAPESWGK